MKKKLPNQEKRFKEARCEDVSAYLPAVRLKDFPGRGLSTYSGLTPDGAVHLTLSENEARCFYTLCFDGRAKEIRTQYPLEPEKTKAIAKALGVRHPVIPGTKAKNLMTTDLFAVLKNGKRAALCVKAKSDLEDKRVREKILIEANYWKNEGAEFRIVTEESISRTRGNNCWYLLHTQEPEKDLLKLAPDFKERLYTPRRSVLEVCKSFDSEYDLQEGSGLHLFHYQIVVRGIPFDMEQDILRPEVIYYAR